MAIHDDAYHLNLAINEVLSLNQFAHLLKDDDRVQAFSTIERAVALLRRIHQSETTLVRGVVALERIADSISADMSRGAEPYPAPDNATQLDSGETDLDSPV